MNEKIKPNFKMKNCGSAERRTKNETVAKLYLADLKRSLAEFESDYDPAPAFESMGEILAKRKIRRASSADHEGHVK